MVSVGYSSVSRAMSNEKRSLSKPIPENSYEQILRNGDFLELKNACINASTFALNNRLRVLSKKLLSVAPSPKTYELVMANANAHMACKSPKTAQELLKGINPVSEIERRSWLILSWQAAKAAMDHSKASWALTELVEGDLEKLEKEMLTVSYSKDGVPLKLSALDLLAEHEQSIGRWDSAAMVLLAGRKSGAIGARRIALAAQLIGHLERDKRARLLDKAFNQAYSDKAWWLVEDILRLQFILALIEGDDVKSLRGKLESLAIELDDDYTLLELINSNHSLQKDPSNLRHFLSIPKKDDSKLKEMKD